MRVILFLSTSPDGGIEEIRVPFLKADTRTLKVLAGSSWAFELLHSSLRSQARTIEETEKKKNMGYRIREPTN